MGSTFDISRRALLTGVAASAAAICLEKSAFADCGAQDPWADQLVADLTAMADHLSRTLKLWQVPALIVRPESFGHTANSPDLATVPIQRAIEACAAAGGGTVQLSQGDYVSGTLDLRSGVMLEIAERCRLIASTNLDDYPLRIAKRPTVQDSNMGMNQSLIFAEGCRNIGICGKGQIFGRGTPDNFPGSETIGQTPGRPFVIRIIDCSRVVVRDIHLKDSPCWMQNYLNCEDLLIDGVEINNQANFNNDGLDIDSCRRVIVRNTTIISEDDTLCFKGAGQRPMEQVLVENCHFYSSCNAIKFGTDTQGDFRNILVRNVELGGLSPEMLTKNNAKTPRKADGGVSWETVDGATCERILVQKVHVVRAESPLFLRLGNRGRVRPDQAKPPAGILRRVIFEDITGENNGVRGSFFIGNEGKPIEDILLRNINITMSPVTNAVIDESVIPENPDAMYPDPHMFDKIVPTPGVMPAYGLWTRHVHNLVLDHVHFQTDSSESRPAVKAGADTIGLCQRN
ncbi:glycosyl hydrolase family 28 protein [Telmatospirillum sp.]|uniref:glycoside hydrolase family 28 protein n=1 Tax=Telmatospirillum sp. TaxID=2079197 RepID=UPI00284E2A86|nr:glycosyl hydrolase family 28 protein [Telmatospirillum sp.]MDR3435575.1 glycosyl hydrolase family 28 protein [Telmatospirillum sp.]